MSDSHFIHRPRPGPLIGVIDEIIHFSSSGDNVVISAVPDRIIKIHKLFLVGASASNIRFWSGPSSENIPKSGLLPFGANFGLAFDGDEFTLEMGMGKSFVINSSIAIQCGGWVTYTVY